MDGVLTEKKLPRVIFVLGKGGVGRSTVSCALAMDLARRHHKKTLVFGWTISDPIAPWFDRPPARLMPAPIAERVSVSNYFLDDTLQLYFVNHLHLPRFYKHVIRGDHVKRLIEAAPGLAEVFFIGHIWWLTTLAKEEAGIDVDHVIVDAPATGHGVSLFDLPAVLSSVGSAGLLRLESDRVTRMMSDPEWTGAVVVSLAEELSAEETVELVPRVTERMGRKPLAAFINRSVAGLGVRAIGEPSPWLEANAERLSPESHNAVMTLRDELRARRRYEIALRKLLGDATTLGVFGLHEQLALRSPEVSEKTNPDVHGGRPRDVVDALSLEIGKIGLR